MYPGPVYPKLRGAGKKGEGGGDLTEQLGASDHHKLARDEFNGRVRAECMEAVYEVVRKVTDSVGKKTQYNPMMSG